MIIFLTYCVFSERVTVYQWYIKRLIIGKQWKVSRVGGNIIHIMRFLKMATKHTCLQERQLTVGYKTIQNNIFSGSTFTVSHNITIYLFDITKALHFSVRGHHSTYNY